MSVSAYYQPSFTDIMASKSADFSSLSGSTSLKCMLLTGTATARSTTETWEYVATATTANPELSATGYTAGGATLTSVTYSTSGLVSTLTCANVSWSSATWSTATMAIFYDSTGATASAQPIIAIWDFGGAQSVSGGTFTLQINASGLVTWTAAA